jgi:hypothetical protein
VADEGEEEPERFLRITTVGGIGSAGFDGMGVVLPFFT